MKRLRPDNPNTAKHWNEDVIAADWLAINYEHPPGEIVYDIMHHIPHGVRVLDVGAGSGMITRWIKHLRPNLWLGVADYSLPAIDWIREHIPTNELFFVDLTKGINRPDKSYDVVMCTEVIEHMEEPQAAIAELARIARQRLIITVPYGDEADKSVEHIWALWLDDLYELLNPYGKVFLTVSNGGSNIVAACHIRQA